MLLNGKFVKGGHSNEITNPLLDCQVVVDITFFLAENPFLYLSQANITEE